MLFESYPMPLGETLAGTNQNGDLINSDRLGEVFYFPVSRIQSFTRGGLSRYTGKPIKAILVRNATGGVLPPKRLAILGETFSSTYGYGRRFVTGLAFQTPLSVATAKRLVLVDPFLTSNVADKDVFWGLVSGTVLVKKSYANTAADIDVGNALIAATLNTTSGNTTAGGVDNLTAATADTTAAVVLARHIVGYALSALVTNSTNIDLLTDLCLVDS